MWDVWEPLGLPQSRSATAASYRLQWDFRRSGMVGHNITTDLSNRQVVLFSLLGFDSMRMSAISRLGGRRVSMRMLSSDNSLSRQS